MSYQGLCVQWPTRIHAELLNEMQHAVITNPVGSMGANRTWEGGLVSALS